MTDPVFTVPDTLCATWDALSAVVGICSLELETAYEATLGHKTTPEEARVGALYREAIGRIQQYAAKAQSALIDAIQRDPTPTLWEQLLSDPTEQFDKEGIVFRSVLAHRVVLPDGCVDGHSPSRVGCSLGVDWP